MFVRHGLTQCFVIDGHVVLAGVALEYRAAHPLYFTEGMTHKSSKGCVVIGTIATVPGNVAYKSMVKLSLVISSYIIVPGNVAYKSMVKL